MFRSFTTEANASARRFLPSQYSASAPKARLDCADEYASVIIPPTYDRLPKFRRIRAVLRFVLGVREPGSFSVCVVSRPRSKPAAFPERRAPPIIGTG